MMMTAGIGSAAAQHSLMKWNFTENPTRRTRRKRASRVLRRCASRERENDDDEHTEGKLGLNRTREAAALCNVAAAEAVKDLQCATCDAWSIHGVRHA